MRLKPSKLPLVLAMGSAALLATSASAQLPGNALDRFSPRAIGPGTMGGRTVDFAVYEEDPAIFYAATASGGLLKTENGGTTWENVFDRQSTVSIGAVAINPRDPDVVWVGTGEANNRQSSSWGDGVYKSTDGGKSWQHMGLRETHHVGRIVVNPRNPDVVYVAALGHLWGPNPERGLFMTTDGGRSWQHALRINDDTGVTDVAMDPSDPNVLYAAAYQRRRSGWGFNGGGPHAGIHKSTDGGRTWRKLSNGLPTGDVGRIGLDIHRSNPDIVYAIVEAHGGGVFRSEDKGESWTKMNSYNPRPMYFSQIRVDPNDHQRVYVLGVQLAASDDGFKTYKEEIAPEVHLDHHAMWIDPKNSRHIIDGNDGGVWVSRDRGTRWEHVNNYAMGQFYSVAVDMQQPYHVYGGMQDNATWGGPSAVRDRQGIANEHWYQMLACDGEAVALDPSDPETVYANCQNGRIVRYDRRTGERKAIQPQPPHGEPAYRWNWTTPIVASVHAPGTLYTGANFVFKSTDRGHSWTTISPDLTTRTDRDTLRLMGVLVTDSTLAGNDGMASFANITALAESPRRAGLLYAGTDDGKVHVTRDGGATWKDLTGRFRGVTPMIYVSRLTPSAFDEGTVYASFDGHRSDDMRPYVFVITDFGETWRNITSNLPAGSVYVVREDTRNPSLLYVGTEFGLFSSMDRGATWTKWGSFPTVAVYDLTVHPRDNDLVIATHGRSFLVYDDVSPLQEMTPAVLASDSHLFDVRRAAVQFIPNENGWFLGGRDYRAENPSPGAYVNYYLKAPVADARVTITDPSGRVVREISGPKEAGLHRVAWDLRAEPAGEMTTGLAGALNLTEVGPFVIPGEYRVRLAAGGRQHEKTMRVLGDPLVTMSDADRRSQFDALVALTGMQRTLKPALERADSLADGPQKDSLRTEGRAVRGRVNGLKSAIIGSHSTPTAVQMEQLERARQDVDAWMRRMNAVPATAPARDDRAGASIPAPSYAVRARAARNAPTSQRWHPALAGVGGAAAR